MAKRMQEPADTLAAFLNSEINDLSSVDFEENGSTSNHKISCTEKHWKFYLQKCFEVSLEFEEIAKKLDCSPLRNVQTYLSLLKECARIGKWPSDLQILEGAEDIKFMKDDISFVWMWYFWQRDEEQLSDYFKKNCHYGFWGPSLHKRGWCIAQGLERAIECELITTEEINKEAFLRDYGFWVKEFAKDKQNHVSVKTMANVLNFCPDSLSNKSLQGFSSLFGVWDFFLGDRNVPLHSPDLQNTAQWLLGYRNSCEFEPPDSIEDSILLFEFTDDPFFRLELFEYHENDKLVENPEDPFGDEINIFQCAVGANKPVVTYEDALKILDKKTTN